jgi:ATP-dependent Lon protease
MHQKMDDRDMVLTEELPIMPLRNTVVFPHQVVPLAVGREKSLKLLKFIDEENKIIGLVSQKDGNIEEPSEKDLYRWGTAAMILKKFRMPDGSEQLIVQGMYRIKIIQYTQTEPHFEATVLPAQEIVSDSVEIDALINNLKMLFQSIVDLSPYLAGEHRVMVLNTEDPAKLTDIIASQVNFSVNEKQDILEIVDIKKRLERVHYLLNKEMQVLELGSKIQNEVQGELNKTQRQYYLRGTW